MNRPIGRKAPAAVRLAVVVLIVIAATGCTVAVRGKPFGRGSDEWMLFIGPVTSPGQTSGDVEEPSAEVRAPEARASRQRRCSGGLRPRKDVVRRRVLKSVPSVARRGRVDSSSGGARKDARER